MTAADATGVVRSGRLICQDAWSVDLRPQTDASAEVLAGHPESRSLVLHRSRQVEAGLWQMTEGVVRDVEVDELFIVLGGTATIRFEDHEQLQLVPGTVVRLRAGERVEWTITHRLRKLYLTL